MTPTLAKFTLHCNHCGWHIGPTIAGGIRVLTRDMLRHQIANKANHATASWTVEETTE